MRNLIILILIVSFINCCYSRKASKTVTAAEKCDVSTEDSEKSLDNLLIFGSSEQLFASEAEHNESNNNGTEDSVTEDGNNECKFFKSQLDIFNKHLKCLKASKKQYFYILNNGIKKAVERRCQSEEWQKQYKLLAKCMERENSTKRLEKCAAKFYESVEYISANFPQKSKITATCCVAPLMADCVYNEVNEKCGNEIADFAEYNFWEPLSNFHDTFCRGFFKEKCESNPKELRRLEDIFTSPVFPKTRHLLKAYTNLFAM